MNAENFQTAAMRYLPTQKPREVNPQLMYGLTKLNEEAGEALAVYTKYIYAGHGMESQHLLRELSDVAWALACSCNALGYKLEDIFDINIDKLDARFPMGYYEPEKSINRRADDV